MGACVPALGLVGMRVLTEGSPAGLFQVGLTALTLAILVGARPRTTRRGRGAVEIAGGALLAGLAYALVGAGAGGGLALGLLALGSGGGAAGLAALARALGVPSFPAFAVASLVLLTATLGLHWADPSSAWVAKRARRAYRQAVLQVDPSLALAYDGAHYDRLRAPAVYFSVPLASSAYVMPRASSTGAAWLVVGLVAGGAAWVIDRKGRSVGRRRSPAS